ncbi:MAG: ECF transporter S component, partial [Candidatus Scatosoma sp.]
MAKANYFSAKRVAGLAILLALVIVLQTALGSVKIGATSFSLVLIPIVLGGILYGAWAGAFLGFVFGLITLIYGITGADYFTMVLFQ